MNKVFVYGTLKKGYHNHYLLDGCEYLGNSELDGYGLYYSGNSKYSFPVADIMINHSVSGEIYLVDDEVMKQLDRLESNGTMYHRKYLTLANGQKAHVYIGDSQFWNGFVDMKLVGKDMHVWPN
jgi:gamma-glutamylcyclotransferase (GGCT)/AIG2-like uncharacterized protein YtfP